MIGWYTDLPVLARAGVGLVLIGISTFLFFVQGVVWPWGWVIGLLALILAIPEYKPGGGKYHDY